MLVIKEEDWMKNIWFCSKDGEKILDKSRLSEAINIINYAIDLEKDYLEKECLTGNLKDFQSDFFVKIVDHGSKFEVDLAPKSGEGHDFNFIVKKHKKQLIRDSLSIGEVISEPRD